jgi:hypothetical protein
VTKVVRCPTCGELTEVPSCPSCGSELVTGLDAPALLLRDVESPETFVSFGQWASAAAVRSWRALEGYQERVARLREVVERFEPRTLEVTARR